MKTRSWILWLAVLLVVSGCSLNILDLATSAGGLVNAADSPTPIGDPARGAEMFTRGRDGAPPCITCHNQGGTGFGAFALGPNLSGVHERAASRVPGLTARDYLHQSIISPGSFVVPGFRNIMYPDFGAHYSEQDIADLIAYLLTL